MCPSWQQKPGWQDHIYPQLLTAGFDYLAMMADIDIPTEDKNEMGGVDDE